MKITVWLDVVNVGWYLITASLGALIFRRDRSGRSGRSGRAYEVEEHCEGEMGEVTS